VSAGVGVFLSALAAYAFSRMRFRGRRVGLLALLLIQMFPQFLAVVAIFLMFATITDYWPAIGFNTWWGLILLYLGGALGVNTWLMKGFFDTVPRELDESATMDGAVARPGVLPDPAAAGRADPRGDRAARLHRHDQRVPDRQRLPHRLRRQDPVGRPVRPGRGPSSATPTSACSAPARCSPRSRPCWSSSFLQRYIVEGLTSGAVKG
jgi:hypothetical protein